MMRRAAVFLFYCLGSLSAQNGPFRVQTQVVQVPVRITDRNGRDVVGLAANDFTLLDNGVRQQVTLDDFDTGLAPISLVIAIQTSGISTPALTKIRRIGGMIQPLVIGPGGEAAVVTFDSDIKWLQDFTSDDDKIRDAVMKMKPGSLGQARMLDAIAAVSDRIKQRKGRRMLLLISESRDRGSRTTFQQAMETLERQGVEVFGAHYSAYSTAWTSKPQDQPDLYSPPTTPIDPSEDPAPPPPFDIAKIFAEAARLGKTNAIQALTHVTGGSDFPFATEGGIESSIEKLGDEVHNQYILSFRQREQAAGMHEIQVSVRYHSDLRIRSRRTYWADQNDDVQ